jgi:glutamate/tyrosine decarboxylase-like PLP-dependent enzyme
MQGGTESIIMAIKSHRDYFREYHGITAPEMVVGNSAHAAVDKACDLMNIKLIKVALDPETYKIDLDALRAAIGPNTIMMYASAPSYPHGAIDPVKAMSEIAVQYNIGLHVDCCLGGFVLPFAKKMGYSVPGKYAQQVDAMPIFVPQTFSRLGSNAAWHNASSARCANLGCICTESLL